MNEMKKDGKDYIGYEYKTISVKDETISMLLDSYENFGWDCDERSVTQDTKHTSTFTLKRNRHLVNRTELTRLQRNFESCLKEVENLEKSKTSKATIIALIIGLFGTVFMALSVFSITAENPSVPWCIVWAIPGFVGWLLPYFVYRDVVIKTTKTLNPIIEDKYEEVYTLCEKASHLLMK